MYRCKVFQGSWSVATGVVTVQHLNFYDITAELERLLRGQARG
jgi:hypothetical protein